MQESPSQDRPKDHCDRKPDSSSGFPFGERYLVFKVRGKIFAVLHVEASPVTFTFKADPELTGLLRGQYPCIQPARYFDKRYRSTLTCDATVPDDEAIELLDTSYDIVFGSPKKSDREGLKGA